MTHAISEMAMRGAPLREVRQEARASGMRTLLEDGRRKILSGVTTPEDLMRVTQTAELIAD